MGRLIAASFVFFAFFACDGKRDAVDVVGPGGGTIEKAAAPAEKVAAPADTVTPAPAATKVKPAAKLVVPADQWLSIGSETGGHTVRFPGQPNDSFDKVETRFGPRLVQIAMAKAGNYAFFASWSDYPAEMAEKLGADGIIKDARDHFANKLRATTSNATDVKAATITWHQADLTVTGSPLRARTRQASIRGRVFQLAVMSRGSIPEADAAEFFGSFAADPKVIAELQSPPWKTHKLKMDDGNGVIEVTAPGSPKRSEVPIDEAMGTMTVFAFKTGSGPGQVFLQVAWVDAPIAANDDATLNAGFDGARDNMLKTMNATLVSEKPLSRGDLKGREIIATAEPKSLPGKITIRSHIYIQGKRVFQLQAMRLADGSDKDVMRFLNSFKLQ